MAPQVVMKPRVLLFQTNQIISMTTVSHRFYPPPWDPSATHPYELDLSPSSKRLHARRAKERHDQLVKLQPLLQGIQQMRRSSW